VLKNLNYNTLVQVAGGGESGTEQGMFIMPALFGENYSTVWCRLRVEGKVVQRADC
jgi:hypothetical protein